MKGTKIIFILIVTIFLFSFASTAFSATVTSSSGSYQQSGTRTVPCWWEVAEDHGGGHIVWRGNCGHWCADMGTSQPSSTTEAYSYTVNYTDYTCTYISGVTTWTPCRDHLRSGTSFSYNSFTQRDSYPTCNDSVCISNCYCNSAPTVPVVEIVPNTPPTSPKTAQDLRCEITNRSIDPDLSSSLSRIDSITYKYEWLKNSQIIPGLTRNWISLVPNQGPTFMDAGSNTISNSNTFYKDNWTCRVTPKDNQGKAGNSATTSTTIQNTSPLQPVISSQSERIISNNQIRLGFNAFDPDVSVAEQQGQFLFYYGRVANGISLVPIDLPTGYGGVSPNVNPGVPTYACYSQDFVLTSNEFMDCNASGFDLENEPSCGAGIQRGPSTYFDTDFDINANIGEVSFKWDLDFLDPQLPKEYCEGYCLNGVCEDDAEVVVDNYCYVKTNVIDANGDFIPEIDQNPISNCFRDPENNKSCVSWNRDVIGTPIQDCNGDCSNGVCLESGVTNVGCYSYNIIGNSYDDCRDELIGGNYFLGDGSKCVSTLFKNDAGDVCRTGDIFPGINLCLTYDIFDINADKDFCNTSCLNDSCNDTVPTSERCYVMEFANSTLLDNCLNSGVCNAPTTGAFNRCDNNSANNKLCVTWNLFNPTSDKIVCNDSCSYGNCVDRQCFAYNYEPFSEDYNDCRDSGFNVNNSSLCKQVGSIGPTNSTSTDENNGEVAYSWIHDSVLSGVEKTYCENGCENGLCKIGGGFSDEVKVDKLSFTNNLEKIEKVEKLSFTSLACTGTHINGAPNFASDFIKATNCVNNLTAPGFITLTGLNRAEDNCFKGILFDGNQFSSESDFNCLPVIDNITISNSSSSQLSGTRWIRNHFGNADPYEKVTCEFTAHDRDVDDGRIATPLDYNITLVAKRLNGEERIIDSKSGVVNSGNTTSEEFDINFYPGTNHTYEVGTRLYCDITIDDGFFRDNLLSFTGNTWTKQGPWEDDLNTPNGFIEVVNTIPGEPPAGILDRIDFSSKLATTLGISLDPDVFSVAEGGQALIYFGRFFEKEYPPAYDDGTNLRLGDFNASNNGARYFWIPLDRERIYTFQGRSYDSMEYSPIVGYDSDETPFQPVCADLGFDLNVLSIECNNPTGKTAVVMSVACNKSTEMNEGWLVGINFIDVENVTYNFGATLLNPIDDCNVDQQFLYVQIDGNINSNFTSDLEYGGIYNGKQLNCSHNEVFTVDDCAGSGPGGPGGPGTNDSCNESGFVPMVVDANIEVVPSTLSFQYICAEESIITEVILTDGTGAEVTRVSGLNLLCNSTLKEEKITINQIDLGAYAIEFIYTHAPDTCSKKLSFGISDGTDLNIPDSNIFVIILVLLIVSIIIIKPAKEK
jgi:hypothetical protein